jgi:hypothetical protein
LTTRILESADVIRTSEELPGANCCMEHKNQSKKSTQRSHWRRQITTRLPESTNSKEYSFLKNHEESLTHKKIVSKIHAQCYVPGNQLSSSGQTSFS